MRILRFFRDGMPTASLGILTEDNKVIDLIKLYFNFLKKKGLSDEKAVNMTMDLAKRSSNFPSIWIELKEMIERLGRNTIPEDAVYELNSVKLRPPIEEPQKIVGVALNYRDHAKETGREIPEKPIFFLKSPSSVVGPDEYIIIPNHLERVDYEAELVVVIGKKCKNIDPDYAMDCVLGFTIGNDVSARDIQFGYKNHTLHSWAKSFDTFSPIGPWIVTKEEISNLHNLEIELRLNGKVMQSSNTSEMIFKIPTLISRISEGITLYPGDLIFTGTPAGVGAARKPPRFLKSGDIVEVEIENIGILRNKVIKEGELVEGWRR